MKIGFTLLLFSIAFSGTRASAIVHLCFIIPAVGLVLLFSIQGIGWLAFSPQSPGLFTGSLPSFSAVECHASKMQPAFRSFSKIQHLRSHLQNLGSNGLKVFLLAPQIGHSQSSGISSKGVPDAIPESGSPATGS